MTNATLAMILVLGGMSHPDLIEAINQGTFLKELREHLPLATRWNSEQQDPDSQEATERAQLLAKRERVARSTARALTPAQKATVLEAAKTMGIDLADLKQTLPL